MQDQRLNADAQRLAIELAQQRNTTHSVLRKRVGRGENIALRCSFKGKILSLLLITLQGRALLTKLGLLIDRQRSSCSKAVQRSPSDKLLYSG